MSDQFKTKRNKWTWTVFLRIALALVVVACFTSCTGLPGLTASGGVTTAPPLTLEKQAQKEAEQEAREASERSAQNLEDMRNQAIEALENAMQSFIHDSAGPLTDEARQMMRDIFALKQSLETTSDSREIWEGFHQAQSLLFDAYPIAVSVGSVNPTVVGQRGWQETWWFISSP